MEKYFDKRGILNTRLLKNILPDDLKILDEYFIKNNLNTLNFPDGLKLIRLKTLCFIQKFTLNDLQCKGNNCNNLVSFHNSKPGNFCSGSCKKGSIFLQEKVKESHTKKYGFVSSAQDQSIKDKQTETKLIKKYGEKAKYLLDKELFREEFINEIDDQLVMDYEKAINFLNIKKGTIQKYLRNFNFQVKKTLGVPQTEVKVYKILEAVYQKLLEVSSQKDITIISNSRKILENKKELDFYIPEYKLALECNGIYWHSYSGRGTDLSPEMNNKGFQMNRHMDKVNACEKQGITLFQINEDELNNKLPVWESKIKTKLGLFNNVIYARHCDIREIDTPTARKFLDETHIQGYANSTIKLGLFYKGTLVQILTIGKPRFNKHFEWELIRLSSRLNSRIIGGASKLLKYFERNYNPKNIISYGNRRWVNKDNNVYKALGFEFVEITKPSYYYYHVSKQNPIPLHRSLFQKHKLKDLLETKRFYKDKLTEEKIMMLANFRKMWDAGHLVYTKTFKDG